VSYITEEGIKFIHDDTNWPPTIVATLEIVGVVIELTQVDVIAFQNLFAKYRIGSANEEIRKTRD
jgi:hypothetical protein